MLNFDGLRDKFGDRLVLETDSFTEYFRDASEITVKAPAIIFPDTEEEVIQINKYCRESNIPIVFRGSGTGYTGGAVPVPDCLILSLEHLKKLRYWLYRRRCSGP